MAVSCNVPPREITWFAGPTVKVDNGEADTTNGTLPLSPPDAALFSISR